MSAIPASLCRLVIQRANNRCEYCTLSQVGQAATFHIDHVLPITAGGPTTPDNLALACVACSLHKAAKQKITDHETNELVNVFNPRQQLWQEHFRWEGVTVIGLTVTGRATIAALKMNRAIMLEIRKEEVLLGRHPPKYF
jgi:HNH endonuclease